MENFQRYDKNQIDMNKINDARPEKTFIHFRG